MMKVWMHKRWMTGLMALALFLSGVGVGGWMVGEESAAGGVTAAFSSYTAGEESELHVPDRAQSPSPSSEGGASSPKPGGDENWFSVEGTQTPAPSSQETLLSGQPPSPGPTGTDMPTFLIELVRNEGEPAGLSGGRPRRVLLYHTHTYEAYEQTEADPYKETQQWRTQDDSHNIVCVGEELAALLRGMGIEVVHDTTAFEPPNLDTSYTRSLEMLEKRKSAGETYDLYIDLHRDAATAQAGGNAVTVGDASVAKVMLLIGKGEGQTSVGYEEKPDWQKNLTIAQKMTDELNAQVPGLGKDIRIKSGRFNQHIATGCVLVEVGNNKNTLAEAKAAMPYLADAISVYLRNADEPAEEPAPVQGGQ